MYRLRWTVSAFCAVMALLLAQTQQATATTIPFGVNGFSGQVDGVVTETSPGVFLYEYTVHNTSELPQPPLDLQTLNEGSIPVITQWLLPFFDNPADVISNIVAPDGWEYSIHAIDESNWNYNPADDPGSDTYGVPAEAFTKPSYVLAYTATQIIIVTSSNGIVTGLFPNESQGGFSFESPFGPAAGPVQLNFTEGQFLPDPPLPRTDGFPVPEPLTATMGLIAISALTVATRRRRA